MEINQLKGFILTLILTAMLLGAGVITLDKFSVSTFYNSNTNQTVASTSLNVLTHVAISQGNLTSFRAVNATGTNSDTLDPVCYQLNSTQGTFQYINTTANCASIGTLHLLYGYKDYNTATARASAAAQGEISGIATNWFGIIVTIVILGFIIFIMVRSFGAGFGGGR